MSALSSARVASPSKRIVRRAKGELAAGVVAFQGAAAMAILSGTGKGYYAPADDAKIGRVVGVFLEDVDNTDGGAGDLSSLIDFGHDRELLPFVNDDGEPLGASDREGAAYVLDDQTVSGTVSTAICGVLYEVDGNGVAWVEADSSFSVPDAGLSDVAPEDPSSTAASAGAADEAARQDHKHHIAVATTGAEGLMSAAQCSKLTHLAAPNVLLWQKDEADADAGDPTAEHTILVATGHETFSAFKIVADAALSGDDTDYATIAVQKRDGAGGAASTVASVTTKDTGGTGDWVAFVPEDMGSVAGGALAAGAVLTVVISKSGDGVVVPALSIYGVAAIA